MTRSRALSASLSLVATLGLLPAAHGTPLAGRDVLLWGLKRGCEPLAAENRSLEKALSAQGVRARLLSGPSGQALPSCATEVAGSVCAPALAAACPAAQGLVLGGRVETHRTVVRSRLWLHDLRSGLTAFHDDFCQGCDLQLATALAAHVRAFLAAPAFGRAVSATPSYCRAQSPTATPASPATSTGPLAIAVYGPLRPSLRQTLLDALHKQLALRQRSVLLLDKHSDLKAHVLASPGSQGLGLEIPDRGKPTVFLVDQKSARTLFASLDCADCLNRPGELTARLAPQVAALLDQCTAWSCADDSARPSTDNGPIAPPADACETLPAPLCADSDSLASALASLSAQKNAPTSTPAPQPSLDPNTARTLLALSWGAVAAGSATSLLLFSANALSKEARQDVGYEGTWTRAAWTGLGFTALSLAVAVPTSILLRKSSRSGPAATASPLAIIQCPN